MPAAVRLREPPFEFADLRTVEPAPLPASQRLEQTILFGPIEDRPDGKGTSADRRSAKESQQG